MMDVTAKRQWSRARYPLQPNFTDTMCAASISSSSSENVGDSSFDRLGMGSSRSNSPIPWHRAVTHNQPNRFLTESQGEDHRMDSTEQQPKQDVQTISDSSKAVAMSYDSAVLLPINRDYKSRSGAAVVSLTSGPLPRDSQNDGPYASDSQNRDADLVQAKPDISIGRASPTPTPTPTLTPQEDPQQAQITTPKRTLRRTPRSRRINSSVSPEALQESSNPSQLSETLQSPATSENQRWKRQIDLLQSNINGPTTADTSLLPLVEDSEAAKRVNFDQLKEKEEYSTESVCWSRRVYPLQQLPSSSSFLPATPPLSDSEPDSMDKQPTFPPQESSQAAKKRKSGLPQNYPLQVTASQANQHHSPTPPPSPERNTEHITTEETHQPQESGEGVITIKNKKSRRKTYPLQSPASVASLQHSPTPPASTAEREHNDATEEHTNQPQQTNAAVAKSYNFHRQTYPLQSPASIADLQHPENPPPSLGESNSKTIDETSADHHQINHQPATRSKALGGRVYPMQSPASNLNLKCPSTPPNIISENNATKVDSILGIQVRDDDKPASRSNALRRRVYPLQSPASEANLNCSSTIPLMAEKEPCVGNTERMNNVHETNRLVQDAKSLRHQNYPLQVPVSTPAPQNLPSPLPTIKTQPETTTLSTKKSRENQLATKVINHWRRCVYPIQSPKDDSPFLRVPTPQPPDADTQKVHTTHPIHLPKNIRAIKDAENQHSKGRTIVICLDGTGDKFDNDNSNIVHIVSALKKDDPQQVSYYQAGIGTYSSNGLSSGMYAALDMAVGAGLGLHVRDAYHFLMHTYKEGDKICIFGFSRGAYTARCLAGMIHKVGLLPPRNIQQIPFAYSFYANDTDEGWKQSEDFKKTFCIDVCVYFLGCFDSVASVGFIPRQLPLSSTPTSKPRYFRHAMALDERRAKFKVCRHEKKDWNDIRNPTSVTDAIAKSTQKNPIQHLPNYKGQSDAPPRDFLNRRYARRNHPNITDEEYERLTGSDDPFDTDVLEVWFAGAHADVGGGAVPNDERHKLAQIPLRWMIRQAFECNTGIIFKTKVLAEFGLDVHTLWPKYKQLNVPAHGPPPSYLEKFEKVLPPRSIRRSKLVPTNKYENGEQFYHLEGHADEDWTPEQVEDFYDAMSPLNDQLVQVPTWWILEVWPIEYEVPTARGEFYVRTGMNLGRHRGVDDFEPNLHWTVLHRSQHMGYKVRVRTAMHTTWKTVV